MVIKAMIPLPVFLCAFSFLFIANTRANDRYILQHSIEEDGNSVTEVYLDQQTQRLIVKEFDRERGAPARTTTGGASISEAWNPSPRGWSLRKSSSFDLTHRDSQESAQEFLRRHLDSDRRLNDTGSRGAEAFNQIIEQVRTGGSRYRLIQMGNRETTQVGVYHNRDTGEFVFQSVSNQGNREHAYQRTSGLLTDIRNLPDDQNPLVFKRMSAKTVHQAYKAKEEIDRMMEEHGFRLPPEAFQQYIDEIRRYQDQFERVMFRETSSGVFEEALHNPITNELLFRSYYYGDNGEQVVIEEKFYDLTNDVGLQAAYERFQGAGESEVEALKNIIISNGGCLDALTYTMPLGQEGEDNIDAIQDVIETMWRNELQAGLPETLSLSQSNTATLNFSLFGREHPLVINFDQSGRISDINFRHPELARDKKMRIRHVRNGEGEKQFMVEAYNEVTGEYESQLVIEAEQGYITDRNNRVVLIPRLATYLRGQRQEGDFNYSGFEKSTYDLTLNSGRLTQIAPRFRLDGERHNPYAGVEFERNGEGGIVNFAFHLLFSPQGKRDKVRDTILSEARETIQGSDFGDLITDRDIVEVAEAVTNATAIRTDNFGHSKNRVEAVATEEAYSRFGDLVLRRMVGDLLPKESPEAIADLVTSVLGEFRLCLRRSSDARNTDMASNCMDIFMREAPVDVAKEILKLKLIQAGLGDFTVAGENEFQSCTQEHYDPIKARITSESQMTIIQGCLYRALLITVDNVAPALVDENVSAASREFNLNLTYSRERLAEVRNRSRECMSQEGLGTYGSRGYQTSLGRLGNMGADLFEQAFMGCINIIVEDVALSIGQVALAAEVSELDLSEEAKNEVIRESYEPGLVRCINDQKAYIARMRERYQTERAQEVARQGDDSNLRLNTKVPSFDPLECTRILTVLATGNGAEQTFKSMVSPEAYAAIVAREGDPVACFDNLHSGLVDRIPQWLMENTEFTKEEKDLKQKERDAVANEATANCLKRGIATLSFYVTQTTIDEMLSENPVTATIELSAEARDLIGNSVKACFERELAPYANVETVLQRQEELKDLCAIQMLQDPTVQPALFGPFIEDSLKGIEMSEETKAYIIRTVSAALGEKIKGVASIEEAMNTINNFKDEAVPIVLSGVLSEKLETMIPRPEGQSDADREASLLSYTNQVQEVIFGADGNGELGQRLINAINSKDQGAIESAITEIEMASTGALAPVVLRGEAEKLLADGVLESPADVEFVVEEGGKILAECLSSPPLAPTGPPQTEEAEPTAIDRCVEETTVGVTELILRRKLREAVESEPLLRGAISESDFMEIENALLTDELMADLRQITTMEDGPDKAAQMEKFVLAFTIGATSEIFSVGAEGIVEKQLRTPRHLRDGARVAFERERKEIALQAADTLAICLDEAKVVLASGKLEEAKRDSDKCMNDMRFNLTQEILPRKLKAILAFVHGDARRVHELSSFATGAFDQCATLKSPATDSKVYGNHLDACLNETILNFVGRIADDLRSGEQPLLAGTENRANWDQCVGMIETEARNYVFPQGVPENLQASLTQKSGQELFNVLFEEGRKQEPMRDPNVDWLIRETLNCVGNEALPDLIAEASNGFLINNSEHLDEEGREAILSLSSAIREVLETPRENGTVPEINFSPLIEDLLDPNKTGQGNNPPTPIADAITNLGPTISVYINQAAGYDPERFQAALEEFKERAKSRIGATSGEVSLGQISELLMEGDFPDVLLESMLGGVIQEETRKALINEGATPTVSLLLGSRLMVQRLFGSGRGKEVLEKIKRDYLGPLLAGELEDAAIPPELMNEAIDVIVSDTVKGGFVETLMGPIIQKSLNEKRNGIDSGWGPWRHLKVGAARIFGYNINRDFEWGNRFDPVSNPNHLRNTPSGQRAIAYFAENILRPQLTGSLTPEARERATEEISDLLKQAMGEND